MTSGGVLDGLVPDESPKPSSRNGEVNVVIDEASYRLLRFVEERHGWSQRELAGAPDIILGKVDDCLCALVEKGWVRARNFRGNQNKLVYAYLLTPRGLEQKTQVTSNFIHRKMAQYEALGGEIAQLRRDFECQQSRGAR